VLSQSESESESQVSTSATKSALLDRKIEEATAGLTPSVAKQLHSIGEEKVQLLPNMLVH
jgi:hypothetical protein